MKTVTPMVMGLNPTIFVFRIRIPVHYYTNPDLCPHTDQFGSGAKLTNKKPKNLSIAHPKIGSSLLLLQLNLTSNSSNTSNWSSVRRQYIIWIRILHEDLFRIQKDFSKCRSVRTRNTNSHTMNSEGHKGALCKYCKKYQDEEGHSSFIKKGARWIQNLLLGSSTSRQFWYLIL